MPPLVLLSFENASKHDAKELSEKVGHKMVKMSFPLQMSHMRRSVPPVATDNMRRSDPRIRFLALVASLGELTKPMFSILNLLKALSHSALTLFPISLCFPRVAETVIRLIFTPSLDRFFASADSH